jgi:uncharacterized protein (TIGR01777 family)
MKILITGGSGFVGSTLAKDLLAEGHQVLATGTSPKHKTVHHENFRYIQADTTREGNWQEELKVVDGVINLAGRSIFGRWTGQYKKQIYDSRILTTRNVVDALVNGKGSFLCSASAVGYYGDRGDDVLTEADPAGKGFLAEVGQDWENEALRAKSHNIRVTTMRFGIILGKGGGAMEKMVPAYRMYVGGPLGDGTQWFPWIHLSDVSKAIQFLMNNEHLTGVFNFCSPHPVRNRDLAKTMGKILKVPAIMPAPKLMIRMVMGEMASALFDSHRVNPERLLASGFEFQYANLEPAIQQIVQ